MVFLLRRSKWRNANGKIQHFPLTSPLSFELKCVQAPRRKRSASDVIVSVLVFNVISWSVSQGLINEVGCEFSVKALGAALPTAAMCMAMWS